jgi:RNA polymerase sigma factor (sigma-70 family)
MGSSSEPSPSSRVGPVGKDWSAFVDRYLPLVYSACLRKLGRADLADEAAQAVLVLAARKGDRLTWGPALGGWLYRSAYLTAYALAREEARRGRWEREAAARRERSLEGQPVDDLIGRETRAVLDDALMSLPSSCREAIVARYLEGQSIRDVGERLRCTERKARTRVEQGLDLLRRALLRRGVAVAPVALAGFLASGVTEAVPDALRETAVGLGAAGAAAAGPAFDLALVVEHGLFWGKVKLTIGAAAALGAASAAAVGLSSRGIPPEPGVQPPPRAESADPQTAADRFTPANLRDVRLGGLLGRHVDATLAHRR